MTFYQKIKQFFYSFTLNGLEFVFFFTHYWWWKMSWLLICHYWNQSGYRIYCREREKAGGLGEENFSFGETSPLSVKLLLQNAGLKEGSVIYDLGSGRGTFLFAAYFLYGLRGIGVELFETYVEKSLKIRNSLKIAGIIFRRGNIVDTDLSQADAVYAAATTYQDDVLARLREGLKAMKPDSIVILVHHTLPGDDFVLFDEGDFPFTWGTDHVYFYRKK
jgi:SAM-dependent methyltransferase